MCSNGDVRVACDDTVCGGFQTGMMDLTWWCWECCTHTSWTWIWFTPWSRVHLPICWWCNGPQKADKPTRTFQRVDDTIQETRLEREAQAEEAHWTFDVREYAIPFTG